MLTVESSTASAPLRLAKNPSRSETPSSMRRAIRLTEATTEAALNASPLWNETPSRSLNCQVVSLSLVGNPAARLGTRSPLLALDNRVS